MEQISLTRKEAADALRISVDKLDELRAAGKIKGYNIGVRVYYRPCEIKEFIERLVRSC